MKKILALSLLLSFAQFSFAQKTFTSKQEALDWLSEIFATNFIKTPVIINSNNKDISYDYKINEDHLLIIEKTESNKIDAWITVPYVDMFEFFTLQKNDYFKKITGIAFKPQFGDSYGVSYGKVYEKYTVGAKYALKVAFPFDFKKGDIIIPSIKNAINIIARVDKEAIKAAKKIKEDIKQKADDTQLAIAQKIKGSSLPQYKVFNSENILVNLYDYVEKYRLYKDKATLLITWGDWCPICLRMIDALLNNGLALKYNIVLINKEPGASGFDKLKQKIKNHNPDYNKDGILQ